MNKNATTWRIDFFLDTQGELSYSPSRKKELLITSMERRQFFTDIILHSMERRQFFKTLGAGIALILTPEAFASGTGASGDAPNIDSIIGESTPASDTMTEKSIFATEEVAKQYFNAWVKAYNDRDYEVFRKFYVADGGSVTMQHGKSNVNPVKFIEYLKEVDVGFSNKQSDKPQMTLLEVHKINDYGTEEVKDFLMRNKINAGDGKEIYQVETQIYASGVRRPKVKAYILVEKTGTPAIRIYEHIP